MKIIGEESTKEFELALNGHSSGVKRTLSDPFPCLVSCLLRRISLRGLVIVQKLSFTLTHQKAASGLIIIDSLSVISCCIDFSKHKCTIFIQITIMKCKRETCLIAFIYLFSLHVYYLR